MRSTFATTLAALSALLTPALAREVYCHYMVGGVSPTHATTDVQQAKALNITAFALDVTNPTESWSNNAIAGLFAAAQAENFKLFFSLDTAAVKDITQFDPLLQKYLGHPAYYTAGAKNYPFVSTFNDGNLGVSGWSNFRQKYGGKIMFVPNFDNANNYYTNPASVLGAYGATIDGAFNWETAWPPSQNHPANVSVSSDLPVQKAMADANKLFMMPLSSLQFKQQTSYGNYYRAGAVVLPQRMEEILAMPALPDAVEVLTWNDGGESHYIGSLWPEVGAPSYSAGPSWDHSAWQPLVGSFARAFRAGAKSSAAMAPASGPVAGALWYHTMTDPSACTNQPGGWQAAESAVNWAVVVAAGTTGAKVQVSSGGGVIATQALSAGLNYGSVPGIKAGQQSLQVVDGSGKALGTAQGGLPVKACESSNYNYQVVGLK